MRTVTDDSVYEQEFSTPYEAEAARDNQNSLKRHPGHTSRESAFGDPQRFWLVLQEIRPMRGTTRFRIV
jgi:hypothetical protein